MSNGIENGLLFNPTQPMQNCIMCKQEFAPRNINIQLAHKIPVFIYAMSVLKMIT